MTKGLELLAPAKNLEQGISAINHGADAVYIGAPAFGARQAVGNSIEDIEKLVDYAHLYGSKVFATVNTLIFDNEMKAAEEMMWQLYNIGVDAAIVQDMGLLETDLPPIELHASTQTHNLDIRRIKFMEQAGFKRIILARETSLEQMRRLREEVTAELEAFVHGALCVCYSGQCYMSQYLTGRSGNRGACSQPCRSAYDLVNEKGKVLKRDEHLLSLKDFSAAQHIESMIDAGVTSFKIEGRLKDLSYVKNVTAYYRRLLDEIIERRDDLETSGSGTTKFLFEPDLQRTFNRGYTDYFLVERKRMASHSTQKSIGKKIGKVVACKGNRLKAELTEQIAAGDGICYLNAVNKLEGFMVNRVEGDIIVANKGLDIRASTILWRNHDAKFEKVLQGETAIRKIAVCMKLTTIPDGLQLTVEDEDGCMAGAEIGIAVEPAKDQQKMSDLINTQLSKLGGTPFRSDKIELMFDEVPFMPSSTINQLRREAIEELTRKRTSYFKPKGFVRIDKGTPYFETSVDGRANIVNHNAEQFYREHGVEKMEWGVDSPGFFDSKGDIKIPLMTTKYCLRYELGQCLLKKCNKAVDEDYTGELYLTNNGKRFRLVFDCKRCEMHVMADDNATSSKSGSQKL